MKTLGIQIATIAAMLAIDMAYDYYTIGYGLHPFISLVAVLFLIGGPLVWEVINWSWGQEHQYEHIVLERAHCGRCGYYKDLVNGSCVNGC